MLKKLLNRDTIRLQVNVDSWEEAGNRVGDLLLENDLIEPDYINRMIEAVHEYGPYIVIAPGIALFHARPESSVKEICLSMITLKEPVEFGAGENDPVDLVFALGAIDQNSHLELMAGLMTILQDADLLKKIKLETSTNEVLNLISEKLSKEE